MNLGNSAMNALNSFFEEFDACHTKPNLIFMPETFMEALKREFPNSIQGKYFVKGSEKIRIVLTKDEEGIIGASFSLDTGFVMEYQ